jgi:phosphate-selective porin OprO and OprP
MLRASTLSLMSTLRKTAALGFVFVVLLFGNRIGQAQQVPQAADETENRLRQLEKEVEGLKESLRARTNNPASASSASAAEKKPNPTEKEAGGQDALKAKEEEKKTPSPVSEVPAKLSVTFDGVGLRFKSEDQAFSLHIGGRLMTDEVWWKESPGLRKSQIPPPGSLLPLVTGVGPGIGDLQDGFFVRRARFNGDGTIYKQIEFKVEFDFENYNNISFDESYIGAKDLPCVDTVRFGQAHVPFGLEAYTSSRFLPMLERSPLFDAFYQEFAPGIFTDTTFLDQRVTTQHMFHRVDNFSQFNGASFGDGKYAYSGRVSCLPIYEDEGRTLLHLGFSYQWRKGSTAADFNNGTVLASNPNYVVTDNTDLVRFRARPSLRDSVGLQGDNARVVDTGNIIADDVQSVNGEFMTYCGPCWVQSETCLAHVDNAVYPASNLGTRRGDLNFYGTYMQIGYFFTGESRGYDKRMGKFDRVRPLKNFMFTRGKDGNLRSGPGAWEILYRYAYLNENDRFVLGGTYGEHTAGLNWYWTPGIKFQLNYINGQRTVPAGAVSGNVQGIGIRGALEF